ncbi:MAG: glycosyltransferase family 39 protein [Burkholderiaceae bacterium]
MTSSTPAAGQRTALIAILSLSWLAVLAWPRPLLLPDEGRYVGVAWEMIRSGDWLVPRLDGLPYFHKPPLFYWLTATSLTWFGHSEWAARVASLIGAWAGAMATFLFVRRWAGESLARLSLIALLAQPLFYLGAQFANLDMLVAACITVTVLLLAHVVLAAEQGPLPRPALAAAWLAAALGVLAKGLIGFVLPALVIGAWLMLRRQWSMLRHLFWWPAILLFLAVGLPWFVAMQWRYEGFFEYFVIGQHLRRYVAGGFNNLQPFWFYPALLAVGTLPWLVWLRPLASKDATISTRRRELRSLMLVWICAIVSFFSLPQSKLIGYVLPAVPPIAVLLADGIDRWRQRWPRGARWWWFSALVSAALSISTVFVFAGRETHSTRALSLALAAERQAPEPVFMIGRYDFDLPFYARLSEPVAIVGDWADPDLRKVDNWRKELADAATFEPAPAAGVLVARKDLTKSLCASPRSWVVGAERDVDAFAALKAAVRVTHVGELALWRVEPASARVNGRPMCAEIPSAD